MPSPTIRSPRVGVAPHYQATRRVTRSPQHKFNLKTKPYGLYPFMIAPVLPGETLKNLMIQTQCWSDPLAASVMKNIGWWTEYYFFYVKHRDLIGYEQATDGLGKDLMDMMVSAESIAGARDADGNTVTYCPPNGVDYVLEGLKRVAEEYFRDEGEAWNNFTVDGVPQVKIYGRGQSDAYEKLTLDTQYEDRQVNVPEHIDDVMDAYAHWQALYDAGLMDMDYDDWMRTYGSASVLPNIDRVDYHIPELVCHWREFQMPTNTVEPTTGTPSTAVGWRVAKSSRKSIFCAEPGWIMGFTVVRPKSYLKLSGNLASMMQTRESWLPAITSQHLDASHLSIAEASGPLSHLTLGTPNAYFVDLKDLLNYGDQFINWATTATDAPPFVDLPTNTGQRRYVSAGDVMQFFLDTTNGRFLQDGIVSLQILGRQQNPNKNLVLGSS